MNIFDFAMKMEKDGEDYYRKIASETKNEKIAKIMNMLADTEDKHHSMLSSLKAGTPELVNKIIADIPELDKSKNIFEMIEEQDTDFNVETSEIELYKTARDLEKKSQDFYLEKAQEMTSIPQKEFFLVLAEEEKRHYMILDKLIASLS